LEFLPGEGIVPYWAELIKDAVETGEGLFILDKEQNEPRA
jgi:hypothetical protein